MIEGTLLAVSKETLALVAVVLSVAYYVYRLGFPKPLAGIPYNPEAAQRFFGDVVFFPKPDAPAFRAWLTSLGERLQSPIVQVFIRPYGKPALVVYDYWEAYDINNRRLDEFDKTERNRQIFSEVVPQNHTSMRASDAAYPRSKNMIKGVMVPSFISEINAPEIYAKARLVVQLWHIKAQEAGGHPFSVSGDVRDYAFDAVLTASFGLKEEEGIVAGQLRHLMQAEVLQAEVHVDKDDVDSPVEFPGMPLPQEYEALSKVTESLAYAIRAVFPSQEMWLRKNLTEMGTYYRRKDQFLLAKIHEAAARMAGGGGGGEGTSARRRSALDHFVRQEMDAAAKAGRAPDYLHGPIRDELLGYIIAGHDSSTSALAWALKYLTTDTRVQHALRQHLRAVHAAAWREARSPTVAEITSTRAPYLDAVVQEVFRCAYTTPFTLREATRDTQIMGHFVPKGTTVWFSTAGPSFTRPAIEGDTKADGSNSHPRNPAALADKQRVPAWPREDVALFRPERWLRPDPGPSDPPDSTYSHVEFNGSAGPMMAFGSGPRGCCGKRLIYLSMRILVTLVLWDFDLLPCPTRLSSDESDHGTASHPKQCYLRLASTTPGS
ncbi:cytochrome P450 monooxygenase [Lecanosticta acicola]|uniref:Cytochrome P450 monooxygenase n=1 Tax=Lecanosticta acicola TaxID=111012 RepID=A0AAI8YY90_9PEZI|nr:cytochrome P450 monooxygenase [Lecanosticta acicola]